MKKIILVLIIFFLFISKGILAQGMTPPPPPIESQLLSSMTGTWVSEPYQMMGVSMTEEATQNMILNSQFLEVDIKSISTSGFIYEGKVLIEPSTDGTLTGWAYDIYGKKGLTTFTGTWKDNTIHLYGKAPWGSESRVINVNGDVMTHNVIYKMKDDKGKEMPEVSLAITYKKKAEITKE